VTEARTPKGSRPLPSPIIARSLRRPAHHLTHRYFVPAPEPLDEPEDPVPAPAPVLPELLLLPPPVVSVDDEPVEEGDDEEEPEVP
jgi:hypothetical protein